MPTSPGFLSGTEVWSVVPTTQPASLGRPMGGGEQGSLGPKVKRSGSRIARLLAAKGCKPWFYSDGMP